jgi:thiol-disulfide isomerase/thioredoxin
MTADPSKTRPGPAPTKPSRALRAGLAVVVAAVAGVAVLYGIKGQGSKETALTDCGGAEAKLATLAPLAKGQVAAMSMRKQAVPVTPIQFQAGDGSPRTLADFKGKTVLFNLWATWCVPCREEMPALDQLQARFGGEGFEVVAVNIDTTRLDRRHTFLREVGVSHLNFYADPSADLYKILQKAHGVTGLPTTFLIDSRSCLLGAMAGGADWASPDAFFLIEAALRR